MQIQLLGINHKTAPLNVREKFVFSGDIVTQALIDFKNEVASEVLILSTCNRTEIYFNNSKKEKVIQWLAKFHGFKLSEIKKHIYHYDKYEAFQHACRVASGIDSMILGETQILGQMKHALKHSEYTGVMGKNLSIFFQKIFETAKKVRSQTKIGASSTSIASVILQLTKKIFGQLNSTKILFIGAGEMTELCTKYFVTHDAKKITIANRSLKNGAALAKKVGAESILIGDINDCIHEFDVVISSTSSQLPIIGLGLIEKALKFRKHKPMLLIDLAIPRDIEEEAGQLDDVFLYTFDNLAEITQQGLKNREQEVQKSELIIKKNRLEFESSLNRKIISPQIKELSALFEKTRSEEIKKAKRELHNGIPIDDVLEKLTKGLTKKLMHFPTKALNDHASKNDAEAIKLLKKIFNLKD